MEDNNKYIDRINSKEVQILKQYRYKLRDIQQVQTRNKLLNKQSNQIQFYHITPKEELPNFLQKLKFQTLHVKQKQIASAIKICKKQNQNQLFRITRKRLKQQGKIMLLSQIYHKLNEDTPNSFHPSFHEQNNQIQNWQKTKLQKQIKQKINGSIDCDYKAEIQRGLQIISVTHASESNLINRYILIQNSSKILKKQLDQKKNQIQNSIKNKMKFLYDARAQYHIAFQQRNRIKIQTRALRQQKQQKTVPTISLKSLRNFNKTDKYKSDNLLDENQQVIKKLKINIQQLQSTISTQEQQLKKILEAQKTYFRIVLKNGNDVRENGLIWIIRSLNIKQQNMHLYQFPQFLDKKSRMFIVQKAKCQEQMENLLEQKKKFVNQIGRVLKSNKSQQQNSDGIMQQHHNPKLQNLLTPHNVPRKYRKSLKKLQALNEQFVKNCSLFQYQTSHNNKSINISSNFQGLTNKQIYNKMGDKIKTIDLGKIKKQKFGTNSSQLNIYQSLLKKIKQAHIYLQDMEIQQQNHLYQTYKLNKDLYFLHASACYGYKKAYSLIIKNFSWDACEHSYR